MIEDIIRTAEEWPFWRLRRPRVEATNAGRSKRALGGVVSLKGQVVLKQLKFCYVISGKAIKITSCNR